MYPTIHKLNVPCSVFDTVPTSITPSTVQSTAPILPPERLVNTEGGVLYIVWGTVTALLAAAVITLVIGWAYTCVIMGQVIQMQSEQLSLSVETK